MIFNHFNVDKTFDKTTLINRHDASQSYYEIGSIVGGIESDLTTFFNNSAINAANDLFYICNIGVNRTYMLNLMCNTVTEYHAIDPTIANSYIADINSSITDYNNARKNNFTTYFTMNTNGDNYNLIKNIIFNLPPEKKKIIQIYWDLIGFTFYDIIRISYGAPSGAEFFMLKKTDNWWSHGNYCTLSTTVIEEEWMGHAALTIRTPDQVIQDNSIACDNVFLVVGNFGSFHLYNVYYGKFLYLYVEDNNWNDKQQFVLSYDGSAKSPVIENQTFKLVQSGSSGIYNLTNIELNRDIYVDKANNFYNIVVFASKVYNGDPSTCVWQLEVKNKLGDFVDFSLDKFSQGYDK